MSHNGRFSILGPVSRDGKPALLRAFFSSKCAATLLAALFGLFAARVHADGSAVTVLFFGDSLTAGYDLAKTDAYPAILQSLAKADGVDLRAVNGGLSGDTSAGGVRRVDWFLRSPADLVVVALGANDGLRGLSVEELQANLVRIIEKIRAKLPSATIVLAGMKLPPSIGGEYADRFERAFASAAAASGVKLYPFLLEGVAAEPAYTLPDRLHPNEAGHRLMAESMWRFLKPLLPARSE